MATMLKEDTTEEQRAVVGSFCGQKNVMQSLFIRKCFLFTARSVCRVKRFTAGSRNSLEDLFYSDL
jgi:hypothetical protein